MKSNYEPIMNAPNSTLTVKEKLDREKDEILYLKEFYNATMDFDNFRVGAPCLPTVYQVKANRLYEASKRLKEFYAGGKK